MATDEELRKTEEEFFEEFDDFKTIYRRNEIPMKEYTETGIDCERWFGAGNTNDRICKGLALLESFEKEKPWSMKDKPWTEFFDICWEVIEQSPKEIQAKFSLYDFRIIFQKLHEKLGGKD